MRARFRTAGEARLEPQKSADKVPLQDEAEVESVLRQLTASGVLTIRICREPVLHLVPGAVLWPILLTVYI